MERIITNCPFIQSLLLERRKRRDVESHRTFLKCCRDFFFFCKYPSPKGDLQNVEEEI